MRGLRYWVAGLCAWLAVLYNLERWNEPINIATFVYVYTLVSVLVILLVPWFQRISIYWLFLIILPPFFLLKTLLDYPIAGTNLPITVTEIAAIGLTIILARQVGGRIEELRGAIADLTFGRKYSEAHTFETGQGQIYREIRRARRFQRSATLMSICASDESVEFSLNRFVLQAQREITEKYISAKIANLLVEELQDINVIAQRDDHFIVLVPEVSGDEADEIVNGIKAAAREKLDLEFNIGVSTFPDEAITFESLLEQAELKMGTDQSLESDADEKKHLPASSKVVLSSSEFGENQSSSTRRDDPEKERVESPVEG